MNRDELKRAAALRAIEEVEDGMVVGLGTGSTASFVVEGLGARVAGGLRVVGIPTSERTAAQARRLGIPIATFVEHQRLDLTIDGADEVQLGTLDLIKGLGGALLREKIVAAASNRLIIVVDQEKLVEQLGEHTPLQLHPRLPVRTTDRSGRDRGKYRDDGRCGRERALCRAQLDGRRCFDDGYRSLDAAGETRRLRKLGRRSKKRPPEWAASPFLLSDDLASGFASIAPPRGRRAIWLVLIEARNTVLAELRIANRTALLEHPRLAKTAVRFQEPVVAFALDHILPRRPQG